MRHVAKRALGQVAPQPGAAGGEVSGTGVEAVADTLNPLVDRFNETVDHIESADRTNEGIAIRQGELLEDITVVEGTRNVISHNLGRVFKGYIIVRNNFDIDRWWKEIRSTNKDFDKEVHLYLTGDGGGASYLISLWIF